MIKLRERQVRCSQWRIMFVLSCCLLSFAVLLGGAAWRSAVQGDMLVSESMSRYLETVKLPGERGVIWDRNGRPLAMSSVVYSAHVNPVLFQHWAKGKDESIVEQVKRGYAESLEVESDRLEQVLGRNKGFAYLRHDLTPEQAEQVKSLKLPYLRLEKRYRRFYMSAQEAAHVIGFINANGKGVAGMEGLHQSHLTPVGGESLVLRTTGGQVLEVYSDKPAVDGRGLVLTLDSRLQYFSSVALERQLEKHGARSGSLILMDVRNGDILALANAPSFNPNNIGDDISQRRNRAVQDIFEPGSTMKPILSAIALEHGLVAPGTVLETARPIRFGRYTVKDKKIDTDLTVAEVIMRSSNVGAVRMAQMLEDEDMWDGYRSFGIGEDIRLGVPGETTGRMRNYKTWRPVEKATMAYGYGVSTNLLQLARAYAAIANNGMIPTPRIVLDEKGPEPARVASSATARSVIGMLENVVSNKGTAPKAAINGYRVAGKTGTTHKRQKNRKGYDTSSYQSVFVGMAPASSPRFVAAVIVDEPSKNGYYGGTVAAPVFAEVMGHALRMYGVPTDAWQEEYPEVLAGAGALASNQ